ncbi:MAG TPA: transcription-repair coupling factor [Luteibaculaceae bacterium]|nr:transcription-repair coupling factor [Luteibaculaceae bacterium]
MKRPEDLFHFYLTHPKTQELSRALANSNRIQVKGLVGSGIPLTAAAVIDKRPGVYLFVLNDKEEAAYFMNDLENVNPALDIVFFPASYRLPYQTEQTDNANVLLRAETLNKIAQSPRSIAVVTYAEALSEKVVTQKHLIKNTLEIEVNRSYTIDFINELLLEFDFEKVDYVYEPGQFSVRGGIVDVFSFSNEYPFRIEFFGDEVESIRKFDPVSQLSVQRMQRINIIPNVQDRILKESRESFLQFIPEQTTIWTKDAQVVIDKLEREIDRAQLAFDKLTSVLNYLPPQEMYTSGESFKRDLVRFTLVESGNSGLFKAVPVEFNQTPQPSFNKNFEMLGNNLHDLSSKGFHMIIAAGNPKQVERLYNIFEDKDKQVDYTPITLEISEGFIDHDCKLAIYTDHQIFERYHRFRLKEGFSKTKQALTLKEIMQLQPGDYVTHIDHGVGKFSGLEKIEQNGKMQEAIRLVYSDNDILYVSIHSLHRISKYVGKEGTTPKVNKLGSSAWTNLKNKTKRKVKEIAFDLIRLYAKRKAGKGWQFTPDTYLQNELEASFIYEDTPDQIKATLDVKRDMESPAPMDRLICGDVGFGKTEIAIRAAFKAATDGKQVAVMVPTTVLCAQHHRNFSERLKDFPVKVDYINRFKPAKQQKETLAKLAEGKIDILIGTHKIIGKEVKFKDLGLLIIDEEQKFGVGVKDKLKTLKANLDVLTLSATPIPRTLQFSLMAARDLSVITTPPPNRYPVQTEVCPFNEEIIRDAIVNEVSRGGQVYFVNNRIQNIKDIAGMIQRLCPGYRVAIGHGQMDGARLEEIMNDFTEGAYDVLVATSIIESGLDISNANTIIINDAHNFGMSDLHQLRGRVGRSNKKAFCYLIAPPGHILTNDARKRLQALEQFSDLGSGMNIAMRDLDIRGAGDLLGGEQSGFISEIGFETYQKILNEAIQELKEQEFADVFAEELRNKPLIEECVFETDFEILIPDDYVNSVAERLHLYKQLDELDNEEQLVEFRDQLVDRFGEIPRPTRELFNTIRLRWLGKEIGFEKLVLKNGKMLGYFITNKDSVYFQGAMFTRVLDYVQTHQKTVKLMEKNDKLVLIFSSVSSVAAALQSLSELKALPVEQPG